MSAATAIAGAGQSIDVDIDVDEGIGGLRRLASAAIGAGGGMDSFVGSAGRANVTVRFFSNALRIVKWPLIISGATLAAQALASLGGAAIAVAGSLSRLAGVAAALPGLLSAVAQGIGSIFFATSGIGDALKAMGDAGISGGGGVSSGANQAAQALKRQQDAAERVEDAQRSLERTSRDSARAIVRAQESVADAARNLQDAQEDAARAVEDANDRVEDSAESLARTQEDAADDIVQAHERVEDAAEDLAQAEEDAARRIADATERVRDAQERLADAQVDARRAQEDLTAARERAAQRLEDLQLRSRSLSVQEARALRDVQRAQRLIEQNPGASGTRQAILNEELEIAKIRLEEIRNEQERTNEQLDDFAEKGVEGSDEVVDAQERLREQLEAIEAAERNLQKATEDRARAQLEANRRVEDAQDRLADAQKRAADAQRDAARRVADAQERLAEAQERVARAQEDSAERIADAERSLTRAREDAAETQLDAQERVEDAQRSLERAVRDSQEAMEDFGSSGGGAIDRVAQALSKLPKSAQEFAKFLFSLKPLLDELRETAADNLFPGLTEAITLSLPLFPIFRDAIGDTAKAIADLAVEGAKLISSPNWMRDLKRLGDQNVVTIRQFGTAGINLADAMRNMSVAAIPLVNHIGELAVKFSEWAREAAEAGQESGRLGSFMERVQGTLDRVIAIAGNLIETFINIGSAGSELGDDLLKTFEELTAGWADFTGSVEGQARFKRFFDAIRPTLTEIGGLITDITSALVDLAEHPSTADFIRSLRKDLLPIVEEILSAMSELGPSIGPALADIASLFGQIVSLPGFGTFIQSVGGLARGISELLENVPGLKGIVSVFLAIQGIALAGKLLGFAAGFLQTAAATKVLSGAFLFFRTVLTGIAVALGAPLGPILLIGAAIAGLAFLVVKNWDTVKEVTAKVWDFFKEHIDTIMRAVVAILTGGLSEAVLFVRRNWDSIRSITSNVWNNILSFLRNTWESIRQFGSSIFTGIRNFLSSIWDNIRSTAVNIWNNIRSTLQGIWNGITSAISSAFTHARNLVVNAFNDLRANAINISNDLLRYIQGIPGAILGALGNLGSLLWNSGQALVQGLIDGVRSMARSLLNAILNIIPGPVRRVVANALGIGSPSKVFRGFGVNIMEGLMVGLRDQRRELDRRLHDLADQVAGTQLRTQGISIGPDGVAIGDRLRGPNGVGIGQAANGRTISVGNVTLQAQFIIDPTDPLAKDRFIKWVEGGLVELESRRS